MTLFVFDCNIIYFIIFVNVVSIFILNNFNKNYFKNTFSEPLQVGSVI